MKKSIWPMFAAFAVTAALLRVWQGRTGFEETGLAARGNLPGLLLPAVLLCAAACFIFAARKLPARRGEAVGAAERFSAENTTALLCIVAGAFLILACAASAVVSGGRSAVTLLLAAFAAASAVSVLYAAFALRRGEAVQGVALLVPVCALIVYLVFLYRADASDPVLARTYIELLAVAALALGSLERAAFAFRDGSPRAYVPAALMGALLSVTAASEGRSLTALLLFAGCALTELGFLASAELEQS